MKSYFKLELNTLKVMGEDYLYICLGPTMYIKGSIHVKLNELLLIQKIIIYF
jgi:hypothetical protein